jgi:hypothetical protein
MTLSTQPITGASFKFRTIDGDRHFTVKLFANGEAEWAVELVPAVVAGALRWDRTDERIPGTAGFWFNDCAIGVESRETFLLRVSNELRKARGMPLHPRTEAFPGSAPTG